jgi:hypothetical protein
MNPQKKPMTKEQSQGLGCLLLIVLAVVIYAASNRTPSLTTESYGQRIDTAHEWVIIPEGVVFRVCPHLYCAVAGVVGDNERAFIIGMISGEVVDDIELWVIARADDGGEAYAPMVYAMPFPTPEVTP